MPNWCNTVISIYPSQNEKTAMQQLDQFEAMLEKLNKHPLAKDEPGATWHGIWLGRILEEQGISWQDVPCRGTVYDFQREDDHLILFTEDAWFTQYETWEAVLQTDTFNMLKYVYMAEEPGMDIYVNTDVDGIYFPEKYKVEDYDSEDEICEYFDSEEELIEFFNEEYDVNIASFKEAEEFAHTLQEKDQNRVVSVVEYGHF